MKKQHLVFLVIGVSFFFYGCSPKVKQPLTVSIPVKTVGEKKVSQLKFVNKLAECAKDKKIEKLFRVRCLGGSLDNGEYWAKGWISKAYQLVRISESKFMTRNDENFQNYHYVFRNIKSSSIGEPDGFIIKLQRPVKEKIVISTFTYNETPTSPPIAYCFRFEKGTIIGIIKPYSMEFQKSGKISWKSFKHDSDFRSEICFSSKTKLENFLSSLIAAIDGFEIAELSVNSSK